MDNLPINKAYHVSTKKTFNKIKREGLIPKIGGRSKKFGEESAGIFLFISIEEAENALMNWLGDEFDEDEKLVLMEVDLTGLNIYPTKMSNNDYFFEIMVTIPIEQERISFISYQ